MIDITKHAVLGKFNDIRPGIYKEYMRDLCTDSLDKHSHNVHKLVSWEYACTCSALTQQPHYSVPLTECPDRALSRAASACLVPVACVFVDLEQQMPDRHLYFAAKTHHWLTYVFLCRCAPCSWGFARWALLRCASGWCTRCSRSSATGGRTGSCAVLCC